MFCRVLSADIEGLTAKKVFVEADVTGGLPAFDMVGLLSSEVREAKERVDRAIANCGIDIPARRITINLAPAFLRKNGTGFDIAIAVAVLVCLGIIKEDAVKGKLFVGELSLDGKVNKVRGILPICIMAKEEGIRTVVVPADNIFEGSAIQGVEVCGVTDLKELIHGLNTDTLIPAEAVNLEELLEHTFRAETLDYKDVKGQEKAKRATMVAVAGFHNLLYIGPPGSGKSMMASRIPTILNRLSVEECLEISKIYSVTGMLENDSLVLTRPFRAPHHSITSAALVGGSKYPKPGEITLAHKGVLFLDEAAEFKKDNIELLRQPLEEKKILVSRAKEQVLFPADFMLVMAVNPCKCGYYPDRGRCRCTQADVDKYFGKIRGPVLDRIDICAGTSKLGLNDLSASSEPISSAQMREGILKAYEMQNVRFQGSSIKYNSQMDKKLVDASCVLNAEAQNALDKAFDRMHMTARGYFKTIKVARTIADISGSEQICKEHMFEALSYRNTIADV